MLRALLIMAITFIGSGGTAYGVSSANPSFPSGNAGDGLLLCVTGLASGSPATPSASGFSGFGNTIHSATALHSSDTLVTAVLFKQATGSESGVLSVSCFGWTLCQAEIQRYRSSTGWDTFDSAALDAVVSSQQYNAVPTGAGSFDPPDDLKSGDFFVACTAIESSSYSTSGHTIVMTGLTFGSSGVLEDSDSTNALGTRFHTVISHHLCTSGNGVGSGLEPTVRFNTSVALASNGVTILFRLREVQVEAEISAPDSINVGLGESLILTKSFTVPDTITVGLTDSVTVLEATASKSVSDTITVALTDAVSVDTGSAFKSDSDTITVAVTESPLILATASISDTATVALTDAVTVLDTISAKSVSDTATVAFTDAVSVSVLQDVFVVSDEARVALDEFASVAISLTASDTISVALTDSVTVTVTAQQNFISDTISVALTDSASVFVATVPVSVSDTATTALTDVATITATLNRLDIMFIGLSEALELSTTLSLADTMTVGLTDTVSVEITFVPGQPMIRRFSQTHALWPIETREGGWIA